LGRSGQRNPRSGESSHGAGINDAGDVAGSSTRDAEITTLHACRYTGAPGAGGEMVDVAPALSINSFGNAINNTAQVAGTFEFEYPVEESGAIIASSAFRYTGTPDAGGIAADLGTLGGLNSYGAGINDAGQCRRNFRADGRRHLACLPIHRHGGIE
jgi:hypothetical protein